MMWYETQMISYVRSGFTMIHVNKKNIIWFEILSNSPFETYLHLLNLPVKLQHNALVRHALR